MEENCFKMAAVYPSKNLPSDTDKNANMEVEVSQQETENTELKLSAIIRKANKTNSVLKIICTMLALLSLALLITVCVLATKNKTGPLENGSSDGIKDFCPEETQLSPAAARSAGLYDDLSNRTRIHSQSILAECYT